MKRLEGKSTSPGFAQGKAVVLRIARRRRVPRYSIATRDVDSEHDRFHMAIARSAEELEAVRERVLQELGDAESRIFSAHLNMLKDNGFSERVLGRVRDELINVEQAVDGEVKNLVALLSAVENEYMQERIHDIEDVGSRVLRHLGSEEKVQYSELPEQSIIVARELLPSDTLHLDRNKVAGIVTERGGTTSHAAILANSLGIPAIAGVRRALHEIHDGDEVLIDGAKGHVIVTPTERARATFSSFQEQYDQDSRTAEAAEQICCVTRDGHEVELFGNLSREDEVTAVHTHNLAGVGLFRTECLFLGTHERPEKDMQVAIYKRAASALQGRPLVIRTLDLGGDKKPAFLHSSFETNPTLGLRGLRFSLAEGSLFRTQIEAILESMGDHDVRLMFPMVIGRDDLQHAIDLVYDVARNLGAKEVPPIGAMIETPAALYQLAHILDMVDFISIGTNDLTQFMLAADRFGANMLDAFSVLHPAVLSALQEVILTAKQWDKPLCVCGESAGEPRTASLLVAMGVRKLSMSPIRAARVRQGIRSLDVGQAQSLVEGCLSAASAEEVREIMIEAGLGLGSVLKDSSIFCKGPGNSSNYQCST